MPKKTRREKLRAARRPVNVPTVQSRPVGQVTPESATRSAVSNYAATAVRPNAAAVTANFDYSYVYRDLRRILLVAGTFFAILIALSFVIR